MSAPTAQTKKQEAAIAQNKQSLREAEESRIVSSWLKASLKSSTHQSSTTPSTTNSNNEENLDDEESDFSANEEGESGLGYVAPQSNITGLQVDRQHLSANDKLRRQMLGKNAFKSTKTSASKPLPLQEQSRKTNSRNNDDDDDDTEGRTRVAGKRSNGISRIKSPTLTGEVDGDGNGHLTTAKVPSKKRPASYLDEMLAKRSAKKNKAPQQPPLRKAKKSDLEDD